MLDNLVFLMFKDHACFEAWEKCLLCNNTGTDPWHTKAVSGHSGEVGPNAFSGSLPVSCGCPGNSIQPADKQTEMARTINSFLLIETRLKCTNPNTNYRSKSMVTMSVNVKTEVRGRSNYHHKALKIRTSHYMSYKIRFYFHRFFSK